MFETVAATAAERRERRPGDELVPAADVVMDRGFTVAGRPESVWPWIVQLGKRRAGWYLPRRVERLMPQSRRATREIVRRWQQLGPGDVIPDYGGRHETFTVATIEPPTTLVYRSHRGHIDVSWSIVLRPDGEHTRVLLRLRLGSVRRKWLAETAGELLDLLTIAGLAAGLRERLASPS
ncbi:hypothetical protein [Pseudonocardia alaniniphila]|uniref:Polyketide cyclase/dehydrase/lipid transport protein n=1 Tax=Pseudonocardia alaniniphila TaxID=75291 RepID=A0ABS9TUX5_9PSEU|nr:hypothetical protein [Pseudonocardia alaniniphila]MCH6172368.1 hypothetical protein [Pseudonocardia alaniniphila]